MDDDDGATLRGEVVDDWPRARKNQGPPGPRVGEEGCEAADGHEPHCVEQTLLRMLELARERRGSPPLWDAVAARLDAEERRRDVVLPMLHLLDRIRERVDEETWQLILDFEWRSSREVVSGVEVGLELGYDHGRAAALLDAQPGPGDAAEVLAQRLVDVITDAGAGFLDVLLALVATLQTVATMGQGEQGMGRAGLVSSAG